MIKDLIVKLPTRHKMLGGFTLLSFSFFIITRN